MNRPGGVSRPERRVAVLMTVASALTLGLLALWFVPWHPVPGGMPEAVSPGSLLTPEQIDRAEAYSRGARLWSWSSLIVSLTVSGWLGFGSAGRRLVDRIRGPWWWRVLVAVAAVALLVRLITLPFAILYRRQSLSYGLSTQSWAGFARDLAVGQAVTIVTTAVGLIVLIGCARRWRRAWPAVAGLGLATLVMLGSYVYPVLVEPLFNEFTPLHAGQLRSQILDLADAEQVAVSEVLVADASRRTTTLNAYVSGWGSTRRVVVYDTLVRDLPQEEALSVVAHELAHARHRDVVIGTTLGAAGTALGVGLLALAVGAIGGRRPTRGITMADPAVVPVVLALLAVGMLVASPVENGVSRQIETRADVDALRVDREPHRIHRDAARAVGAFPGGPHPAGLVAVVVRESSHRAPARGSGSAPGRRGPAARTDGASPHPPDAQHRPRARARGRWPIMQRGVPTEIRCWPPCQRQRLR